MPKGFTQSLAERLDSISKVRVKEAAEGDVLENGVVYISMGGQAYECCDQRRKGDDQIYR